MSEGINLSSSLDRRLDAIADAANELFEKQIALQEQFQAALREVEQAAQEATEEPENDGYSANQLFSEDPLFDELNEVARILGGKLGGEYDSPFEFQPTEVQI